MAKQLGISALPQKVKKGGNLTPQTNRPSFLGNQDISLNSLDRESHSLVRDTSMGKFINGYGGDKHQITRPQRKSQRAASHEVSTFMAGHKAHQSAKEENHKNVSLSNLGDESTEFNMTNELDDKFKKYIAYKALEKERLNNASVIVSREEELLRNKQKRAYEEKFERWTQKMESIRKQNAKVSFRDESNLID